MLDAIFEQVLYIDNREMVANLLMLLPPREEVLPPAWEGLKLLVKKAWRQHLFEVLTQNEM